MICAVFWCRILNNVYFVGIYLSPLHKYTAMITAMSLQLCFYQHHHPTTLHFHHPHMKTTEIRSNILLGVHVPLGLDVRTGDYSMYLEGSKYLVLVE